MKSNCSRKNKFVERFQDVFIIALVLLTVITLILPSVPVQAKALSKIENNEQISLESKPSKQVNKRWSEEINETGKPELINKQEDNGFVNKNEQSKGNGQYKNNSFLSYFVSTTNIDIELLPLNLNFNQWIAQ